MIEQDCKWDSSPLHHPVLGTLLAFIPLDHSCKFPDILFSLHMSLLSGGGYEARLCSSMRLGGKPEASELT